MLRTKLLTRAACGVVALCAAAALATPAVAQARIWECGAEARFVPVPGTQPVLYSWVPYGAPTPYTSEVQTPQPPAYPPYGSHGYGYPPAGSAGTVVVEAPVDRPVYPPAYLPPPRAYPAPGYVAADRHAQLRAMAPAAGLPVRLPADVIAQMRGANEQIRRGSYEGARQALLRVEATLIRVRDEWLARGAAEEEIVAINRLADMVTDSRVAQQQNDRSTAAARMEEAIRSAEAI